MPKLNRVYVSVIGFKFLIAVILIGISARSASAQIYSFTNFVPRVGGGSYLAGIAVDGEGTIYTTQGYSVVKISPTGIVTPLAGVSDLRDHADGQGGWFEAIGGMALARDGTLFLADNFSVRSISPGGFVTTVAGSPTVQGSSNGVGSSARFRLPLGVAIDSESNVYIADSTDHTIRKLGANGGVAAFAGQPLLGGAIDGPTTTALLKFPYGVALDPAGNLYVADSGNHAIRKISAGVVSTFAGRVGVAGNNDGVSTQASFNLPRGIAVDHKGNVFVTDAGSGLIRKISPAGKVITIGGTAHNPGFGFFPGVGAQAYFGSPNGIAVDNRDGTLYIASSFPNYLAKGTVVLDVAVQPSAMAINAREAATFSVTAQGVPPFSYQWYRDAVPIPAATAATFTIPSAQTEDAGSYSVRIANAYGVIDSTNATLDVRPYVPPNALSNFSVRANVAEGQILIVGASVSGLAKSILVRAGGPALTGFGLVGMRDPQLELYVGSVPLSSNDDWPATMASTFASVGAFAFLPASKDAAIVQRLGGSFTAQAKGTGAGALLVETYDIDGSTSTRISNMSVRFHAGTNADVLIAGFHVAGSGTKQLLIRAVGPALAGFGVGGTLTNPVLRVFDAGEKKIAENDDWDPALAGSFTAVGAFPLTVGSKDSALLLTLPAGAGYTAQVSGADGGTGEALIEIYEIP